MINNIVFQTRHLEFNIRTQIKIFLDACLKEVVGITQSIYMKGKKLAVREQSSTDDLSCAQSYSVSFKVKNVTHFVCEL